jgi:hypothetical protein
MGQAPSSVSATLFVVVVVSDGVDTNETPLT